MEENNNKEEYISLIEASRLCEYSEPYLRLRSRQGKLKSIKLGKKWMTKAIWVEDYVSRARAWNEKMEQKRKIALPIQKTENIPVPSFPEERELIKINPELPMVPPSFEKIGFENKPEEPEPSQEKDDFLHGKDPEKETGREFMHKFSAMQGDYALVLATGTLFAIMIFFGVALEKQLIFQNLNQASVDQNITRASLSEPANMVYEERIRGTFDNSSVYGSEASSQEQKKISQEKSLLARVALEIADFLSRHPFPW